MTEHKQCPFSRILCWSGDNVLRCRECLESEEVE